MDDMQVYIANLGKYNEGELVGAWFKLPVDFEEVKEKIGLNDEYEEYAIHDYELPFDIDEYTSLAELNHLYELVCDLPEELQSELSALLTHFPSIEELSEHQDDIFCIPAVMIWQMWHATTLRKRVCLVKFRQVCKTILIMNPLGVT